jgi:hypothetical protein
MTDTLPPSPLPAAPDNGLLPPAARTAAPYFLLFLAVLCVYANSFFNGFVFDDDLIITGNTFIKDWFHVGDLLTGSTTSGTHIAGGFFRPLQMLLYLFAYQLGDGSTFPFHLLNFSLHAANACLMYLLGVRMGFAKGGAFLAALIWGVHPLHTEAVTYMSATADPLFAFFTLVGVNMLLPDFAPRKFLSVLPVFALGLLSKETMTMFPLLVSVCMAVHMKRTRFVARGLWPLAPLWGIAIAFAVWRMHSPDFDGPQTYARLYELPTFANLKEYANQPWLRICTFFATLPDYLRLLAWPTNLHMERSFNIAHSIWLMKPLLGLLFFTSCGVLVLFAAARSATSRLIPLAWGVLWFFAAHAPDSGLLVPMNSLFLEHWMYLPSVGLFLGLAETIARLPLLRLRAAWLAVSGLAVCFALVMADKTVAQNAVWQNPLTFYNHIFDSGERSARARNNLALYYSDRGDYLRAIEQFKQAIALSDAYAETHHNLALTYLRAGTNGGNVYKAIEELKRAIELDARFYRSWQVLGELFAMTGDAKQAEICRAKGRELAPKR